MTNSKYIFSRASEDYFLVYNTYEDMKEGESKAIAVISDDDTDTVIKKTNIDEDTVKEIQIAMREFAMNDPKYRVGYPINFLMDKDLKGAYLKTLEAALHVRAYINKNGDETQAVHLFERAKKWLESTDFFVAPASTRFHDAEPYGLLRHTLKVYNNICDLWKLSAFRNVNIGEAALVALVHDWCKIDVYEQYMRNVKDEATGQWNSVPAYRYTEAKFPFGHGETSMYLASKFFGTSLEESLAIRWHMGKWYTDDNLDNDLSKSCEKYPLVLMLQFADHLATTEYCNL